MTDNCWIKEHPEQIADVVFAPYPPYSMSTLLSDHTWYHNVHVYVLSFSTEHTLIWLVLPYSICILLHVCW